MRYVNHLSEKRDRKSRRGRSQSETVGDAGVLCASGGDGSSIKNRSIPHQRKHSSVLSRVKTVLSRYFLSDSPNLSVFI